MSGAGIRSFFSFTEPEYTQVTSYTALILERSFTRARNVPRDRGVR